MMDFNSRSNIDPILNYTKKSLKKDSLKGYLKEIYIDLSRRSRSDGKLAFYPFQEYLQLPIIISEKIFNAFDEGRKRYLTINEFVDGLYLIYCGRLDQKVDIIFKVFDFDSNGIIKSDDITLLLCHFHMVENDNSDIDALNEIVHKSFKKYKQFSLNLFLDLITGYNSDIFSLFIMYLAKFQPFSDEQVSFYSVHSQLKPIKISGKSKFSSKFEQFLIQENEDNKFSFSVPPPTKELFQYLNRNFDLAGKLQEGSSDCLKIKSNTSIPWQFEDAKEESGDITEMLAKDVINNLQVLPKSNENNLSFIDSSTSSTKSLAQLSPLRSSKKLELFKPSSQTPSLVKLSELSKKTTSSKNICNPLNIKNENDVVKVKSTITINPQNEIILEKLNDKNQPKQCKLVLIKDNLFYLLKCTYKNMSHLDPRSYFLKRIISLKHTWVKRCGELMLGIHYLYHFQLISNFDNQKYTLNFVGKDESECSAFITLIEKTCKYEKITEEYILGSIIGKGAFGTVRLGVSKETEEEVAIKTLKRSQIAEMDYQMVKYEIDITKFLMKAYHPGIIKAMAVYENATHIYLVYEYHPGGRLGSYLKSRKGSLGHDELMTIIGKLLEAVKFLHYFGIAHRDLKLDNILLEEKLNGEFQLKVIDFGLSKVLGKYETTNEPYGSLIFASPEVILKDPYNHKADIWSVGVIIYFMIFNVYPFDDENHDSERISKLIINGWYQFPFLFGDEIDSVKSNETLRGIISSCLQVDFKTRPDAGELISMLNG